MINNWIFFKTIKDNNRQAKEFIICSSKAYDNFIIKSILVLLSIMFVLIFYVANLYPTYNYLKKNKASIV